MSDILSAEYVEQGFLSRDKPVADRNADGWPIVHAPDLPLAEGMFYRVRLAAPDQSAVRDVVVVAGPTGCVDPALGERIVATTGRIFPNAALAAFLTDGPGVASVHASGPAADTAVAVAVVKYAAGWDEAQSFALQVDQEALSVRLAQRGRHFEARVSEGAVEQPVAADGRGASDPARR